MQTALSVFVPGTISPYPTVRIVVIDQYNEAKYCLPMEASTRSFLTIHVLGISLDNYEAKNHMQAAK